MIETLFVRWLRTHGQTTETLWAIQNCLGTILGFDHPEAVAAKEAWERSRYPSEE